MRTQNGLDPKTTVAVGLPGAERGFFVQRTSYFPRGSKYPMIEGSGSQNHTLKSVWDQRPFRLDTWTLWEKVPDFLLVVSIPCFGV